MTKTSRNATLFSARISLARLISPESSRQVGHQVVASLSSTSWPSKSDSLTFSPVIDGKKKSGAGSRKSGSWKRPTSSGNGSAPGYGSSGTRKGKSGRTPDGASSPSPIPAKRRRTDGEPDSDALPGVPMVAGLVLAFVVACVVSVALVAGLLP